ncbi:hypothetical protein [Leisingera thetidis]|uniref:hypothetical protein n=1 Tax=Leisingera thetidis TaxID=2930199 RepID=UPI0021F7E08E|nr:hypothetical protein [Leisingera thetidis]
MPQSRFKRPPGFEGNQTDPEESYRAGYQHSGRVILRFLESSPEPDLERLRKWVDAELTGWRHDTEAQPTPPEL